MTLLAILGAARPQPRCEIVFKRLQRPATAIIHLDRYLAQSRPVKGLKTPPRALQNDSRSRSSRSAAADSSPSQASTTRSAAPVRRAALRWRSAVS